jgi:hypothetical protein
MAGIAVIYTKKENDMTTINHWGKWIDSEKPVTGVLSSNSIAWEFVDGEICLTCEEAYKEFEDGSHVCEYGEGCHCEDFIECDSSHDKIIGDWILDTKTGLYDVNKNGEFAAIVRESVVQVVWSKFTAKGSPCSPCYPGQIDLDSDGEFLAYTLPDYLIYKEKIMKTRINLSSGKVLKVSAKQGDKNAPWQPSGLNYRVTVSVNGKRASFDFWDSYHNMVNGVEVDLRSAACSWAGDALAGMGADSADDIASEFGYTVPSEAVRVFKGVKQAEKQAARLGLTEEDLSELYDY